MPQLEGSPSPHRWNQIKRLELRAGIHTLDQYERAVLQGGVDALAYLRGIDPLQELSPSDLRHVHHLMFTRAHPWAGNFRRPGQLAIVSGYPAADPQRIERELELCLRQTREILLPALATRDARQLVAALAFFHVRFERVHPFLDGNGRCGRVVLAVQFEKLFGRIPSLSHQEGYRKAIKDSGRRELATLINYLGAVVDLPNVRTWISPFRLEPRFLESDTGTSMEEDLRWSRITL